MSHATLFHKGKANKLYSWTVWTEGDEIVTEHGTAEGKKQVSRKKATPKNVGRSNETTAEEQAVLEAQAMWTFKKERKYSESPHEAEQTLFLPMLAQDFEKKKSKVSYPVDVQPKLDGVRALATWEGEEVKLYSRSGKEWNIPHLARQLEAVLPKDRIVDGEIYIHGVSFQAVTRLVKKHRPGESERLNYFIYDMVMKGAENTEIGWLPRKHQLAEFFESFDDALAPNLVHVVSLGANCEREVYEKQNSIVQEGFEGAIVRVLNGFPYIYGYRSAGLLKVKTFSDEEFRVVGHTMGVGKFANTPTWECITNEGRPFRCLSKGTKAEREAMGANAESYYGQMLKVRFFEKSEDNIPRFPIGIGFRDPRDMS
jgi:DNA ligase 1